MAAQFIADHLQIVSTAQLLAGFRKSLKSFIAENDISDLQIHWQGSDDAFRSGDWLAGLLKTEFPELLHANFSYQNDLGVKQNFKNNGKILLIDDAIYSGEQLSSLVHNIKKDAKPNTQIFVVTGYGSKEGQNVIASHGATKIYSSGNMPTVNDILESAPLNSEIKPTIVKMYGNSYLNRTLTILAYKIPDGKSSLSQILNGFVTNIGSNNKVVTNSEPVKFILGPELPFYKDQDFLNSY